jgi:hypothetical protein
MAIEGAEGHGSCLNGLAAGVRQNSACRVDLFCQHFIIKRPPVTMMHAMAANLHSGIKQFPNSDTIDIAWPLQASRAEKEGSL